MPQVFAQRVLSPTDILHAFETTPVEEEWAFRGCTPSDTGKWTHDYPLTCVELATLDIKACSEMPVEIYKLMDLYPQPSQRRPSVQYVPMPYQSEKRTNSVK